MALPIVVLDPGHGGRKMVGGSSPNNARGANGLLERDLTLDMALRVRKELAHDADVRLTRDSDVNLSLADRAAVAKAARAQVFISIHFNGSTDTKVDGTEAWIGNTGHPERSALAQSLADQVAFFAEIRNRGVFTKDFGVIRGDRHGSDTAACLLEVSFLSNPKQAGKLAGEAYKAAMAQAIATGIRGHLLGVSLPPPSTSHALDLVAQGRVHVSCPVLSSHATSNNLALHWMVPAELPSAVDVVVHLHGFIGKGVPLTVGNKEAMSGVELEHRDRLTLGLVPVGKKTGGVSKDGKSDVVDFPALLSGDGLNKTIRWSLDWYAKEQLGNRVIGSMKVDRLVLTAHSGGGARLLKLLAVGHDPQELHLFDCFYETPTAARDWAARHIATDAAMLAGVSNENDWVPFMRSRGGALCCAWEGTGTNSVDLKTTIDAALAKIGNERIRSLLRRYYRVLHSGMGHNAIPKTWGPVLLRDATASPSVTKAHALDNRPSNLRQRIVDTALAEFARWDRGKKTETAADLSDTLRDYWATGTGTSVSKADVRSAVWQDEHPWSAAFISWVMHTAGAGKSFDYSGAHATYIATAKKSREGGDATKFQAYRIDKAVPEVGDLVCKDRKVCKKRDEHKKCTHYECSGTTYDNVARGRATHSDIVVEVDTVKNRIRTIGGNVSQSVGEKWISLTAQGGLPERAKDGCRYIAVLKPPIRRGATTQAWSDSLDATYDDYNACLRDVRGLYTCPKVPPLCLRPRGADALPGSKAIRLPGIWNESEPDRNGWDTRDQGLYKQVVGGNVPDFLRHFVPVKVSSKDGQHNITYYVMPDYLAVGSDADYVTVPLGGPTAERVAEAFGCILPTSKMVWDIYKQAGTVRVPLEPRGYAGAKDRATQQKQASTWAYEEYSRAIQRSIDKALAAASNGRGALVAGHRKDVTIGIDLLAQRGKLLFFGGWLRNQRKDGSWHEILQGQEGGYGQTGPHSAFYADYSHGVRLVSRAVSVDGQPTDIAAVLKDRTLCGLLINGGPLDVNLARYNATGNKAQSLDAVPVAEQRVVAEMTQQHADPANFPVNLPEPGSGVDTLSVTIPPGLKFSHSDVELLEATALVQAVVESGPRRGAEGQSLLRVRWSHPAYGKLRYRLRVYASADGASAPVRVVHGSAGFDKRSRSLVAQGVPVEVVMKGEKARLLYGALQQAQKRSDYGQAIAKAAIVGVDDAIIIGAIVALGIAVVAAVVAGLGLFVLYGILTDAMKRGYDVRDTKYKMAAGDGQARQEHELVFNLRQPEKNARDGEVSAAPEPAAPMLPDATKVVPNLLPPIAGLPRFPGMPG